MNPQFTLIFVNFFFAVALWAYVTFRRPEWTSTLPIWLLTVGLVGAQALIHMTPVAFMICAVYLGCIAWETARPRNNYTFGSKLFTYNAINSAAKKSAMGVLGYLTASLLSLQFPSPLASTTALLPTWGLVLFGFLVSELVYYWSHRLEHTSDLLWEFHKVHHSTRTMTALAGARTHWIEWFSVVRVPALLIVWLLALPPWTIILFDLVNSVFSGAWSHANIDFPKGKMPWWGYIFITPNDHGTHHSRTHICNFGGNLILWDRLFGTYRAHERGDVYGITEEGFDESGIIKQQVYPFLAAFGILKARVAAVLGGTSKVASALSKNDPLLLSRTDPRRDHDPRS